MQSELESAIRERRIIEFEYEGRHRVVHPHLLGRSTHGLAVLAFQAGGSSSREGLPSWGFYYLDGMSQLYVSGNRFIPEREFSPQDRRFVEVIAFV